MNGDSEYPWKSNNPGLSPAAWDRLHKIVARLNLKYGLTIESEQSLFETKDSSGGLEHGHSRNVAGY